ncbi:hypothetical protein K1719_010971 [Acacia pycnantha]|nr:hypothetical protein K1719_010971 [Acacia pycnantha]
MESRAFFSTIISPFWSYSTIFIAALFSLIKALIYPHSTRTLFHKHRLPPGPKPWPITGNLPEMLSSKSAPKWIHQLRKNMNTEIACIKLRNVRVIPVINPTLACEFLKKHDDIFASRPERMPSGLFSRGYKTRILLPYGEQWKKILLKDLLSPAKHRWLHDKIMEEADNLMPTCKVWEEPLN